MTHGHTVLFLPPYRPELNAIETAWAVVKNFVAKKNQPAITFRDLQAIIQEGFTKVCLETWTKLDDKVKREEEQQRVALLAEKTKLDEFRELHPDLVFDVNGNL